MGGSRCFSVSGKNVGGEDSWSSSIRGSCFPFCQPCRPSFFPFFSGRGRFPPQKGSKKVPKKDRGGFCQGKWTFRRLSKSPCETHSFTHDFESFDKVRRIRSRPSQLIKVKDLVKGGKEKSQGITG